MKIAFTAIIIFLIGVGIFLYNSISFLYKSEGFNFQTQILFKPEKDLNHANPRVKDLNA